MKYQIKEDLEEILKLLGIKKFTLQGDHNNPYMQLLEKLDFILKQQIDIQTKYVNILLFYMNQMNDPSIIFFNLRYRKATVSELCKLMDIVIISSDILDVLYGTYNICISYLYDGKINLQKDYPILNNDKVHPLIQLFYKHTNNLDILFDDIKHCIDSLDSIYSIYRKYNRNITSYDQMSYSEILLESLLNIIDKLSESEILYTFKIYYYIKDINKYIYEEMIQEQHKKGKIKLSDNFFEYVCKYMNNGMVEYCLDNKYVIPDDKPIFDLNRSVYIKPIKLIGILNVYNYKFKTNDILSLIKILCQEEPFIELPDLGLNVYDLEKNQDYIDYCYCFNYFPYEERINYKKLKPSINALHFLFQYGKFGLLIIKKIIKLGKFDITEKDYNIMSDINICFNSPVNGYIIRTIKTKKENALRVLKKYIKGEKKEEKKELYGFVEYN